MKNSAVQFTTRYITRCEVSISQNRRRKPFRQFTAKAEYENTQHSQRQERAHHGHNTSTSRNHRPQCVRPRTSFFNRVQRGVTNCRIQPRGICRQHRQVTVVRYGVSELLRTDQVASCRRAANLSWRKSLQNRAGAC